MKIYVKFHVIGNHQYCGDHHVCECGCGKGCTEVGDERMPEVDDTANDSNDSKNDDDNALNNDLEKSRRDEVPSVFLSPAEFYGFPFFS